LLDYSRYVFENSYLSRMEWVEAYPRDMQEDLDFDTVMNDASK